MKNLAFIFARGGSKRLPRKNIRSFCGKPLICHSIDIALSSPNIKQVYVSTDDDEIENISLQSGASIIRRPKNLANDKAPEWLAWQHAINWVNRNGEVFDRFVSLPATSPLRNIEDVSACINACISSVDISISMIETTRSPWFNMVKKDRNGFLKLLNEGKSLYNRRQDTPVGYDLTTVAYVAWPKFILESSSIWDGVVKGVLIPQERAIDIDTETDFLIAKCLMEMKLKK